MERQEAKSIGEILRQYLKVSQLEHLAWEEQIAQSWQSLLGDEVTRETERLHLQEGTLYVTLKSPSLKNDLMYSRQQIIREINRELQSEVVKAIVIR